MNKGKVTILFLALLLPVVIFIFLKSFGKNEFVVEPLFQDSVSITGRCASNHYNLPYQIPDSIASRLLTNSDSLALVIFEDSLGNNKKVASTQINRLRQESSLSRIWYATESIVGDVKAEILIIDPMQRIVVKDCIFLLKSTDNAVLIDAKRRIIGQYNLQDLDEADRLIMEIKIKLKQY